MEDTVKIIEMLPEHALFMAELHMAGISTGFISSLR